MSKRPPHLRIPNKEDWAGYQSDLDVIHLHKLCFGKSNAEVECHFPGCRAIERSNELLFAPLRVFQYYVQAFSAYLMSEAAKGDPDAASSFLGLLSARQQKFPGSVAAIYSALAPCIDFVAAHQEYFEADVDIYGDFQQRAIQIRTLCGF